MENLKTVPKTLSADGKYFLLNRDNLTQPILMQLSQKQKTFPQFFSNFLISTLNFSHFQIKDDPHSRCISQITDSEKLVRSISENFRIKGSFGKQQGKLAQTLLKFERQHLYHIY